MNEAQIEMIRVLCPLCGQDNEQVLYEPWNRDIDPRTVLSASGGVRGTQTIVKCKSCGMIYANPRPAPSVVVESYASSVDEIYVGAGAAREATFRRCAKILEQFVPKRGKLLEVGSAAGFFLKAAREAGWDARGVEPSRWLAEYGIEKNGVEILPVTLQDARFPDACFDVVTMWDVLEHVPDPLQDLHEIYRILKPGGVLLVNYPDIGTWMGKLAGKHWWFLLSVHLTYFAPKTIQAMMEKAGFSDFRFKPHFQTLNLGHLIKMGGLYFPKVARVLEKVVNALHGGGLPIPYYAGQTNVVARKNQTVPDTVVPGTV